VEEKEKERKKVNERKKERKREREKVKERERVRRGQNKLVTVKKSIREQQISYYVKGKLRECITTGNREEKGRKDRGKN
jgi:hypothetical protein